MTGREGGCLFCGERDNAIWHEDGFFLLLDIAPLTEGHALLISDEHYTSAADLPADLLDRLDRLCVWFREVYESTYETVTMFEHGRTGHCARRYPDEQVCNHMHIHLLPMAADLAPAIGVGQRTRWSTWRDLADLVADTDGYVLTDSPQSGRLVSPVMRSLAPHYLRSRAAELLGAEDRANWEREPRRGPAHPEVASAGRRLGLRTSRLSSET
jgi:diadenosine tetraphosphate (Ap4A) HIT family hydrolase